VARTLREGDLDFTFDPGWTLIRHWDREAVYAALDAQVPGSRAVDFVGVRADPEAIFLIEVKDYRSSEGHGTTRRKLADDGRELADIVAEKIRDTVAGLLGAARVDRDPDWQQTRHALAENVWVVLWIEHAGLAADSEVYKKRSRIGAGVLEDSIQRRCRWLKAKAIVCSRDAACLPGLTVKSVAGAARTPGRRN
jgi:hypothetical protein